ncbi:putative RNA-binding protein 19 isoform X2 [Phascolarctos cinereus]|uniref:Probable RNA-binding protein 19 n=1 Tax=Phascolarctos cinereus TaxID=38626 RepID=A0A6P5JHK7_PHACI|nr:probable RNA-binding protein 19 isoform X2 [Phascolarctos cinereus]
MSRLIVKNLPSGLKEERFRQLFAAFGSLTDCSLKFTKDGKFRKFGFVGFKSEEEAQRALDHFHRSFIDTSRVTVEFCKSFGDPSKPRAWSKHSQKATQPGKPEESPVASETQKDKKRKKATGELEKLKKDVEFQEFLMVHQKRTQVATWANDTVGVEPKKGKAKRDDDYLNFDSDSGQESEEEIDDEDSEKESPEVKAAELKELSDMDYLKSKVVRADSSEEEESEDEAMACEEEGSDEEEEQLTPGTRGSESLREKRAGPGEGDAVPGGKRPPAAKGEVTKPATQSEPTTAYTVKLRGAPFNVTEQNVREFLVPLKPVAIRIVRNAHGNKTGYVFVDFSSEGDMEKALQHNREYMGGRYIEVFREKGSRVAPKHRKDNKKVWQGRELKEGEEEEDLADSGRLFVRNLPYTSTEEDLEKMFAKYGPLSEVHYPIDGLTKKPKGFAFITYMFPEHAVKAYAEVDGQVFQGRMLHVLPSTIKKETSKSSDATSSSYKKKKALKDKASSSSSHNWNTLFMGTNAVAEAVAQKYNATKSQVFDHEIKGSVAVRVALGETELVQEVRRFLIENGVSLDSFSQAAGERSKSVILVKNLPAGTRASELQEIFSRHGSLGRVLLPEGGVTAIVEYLEPLEARRGFTSLAYSKFHDVPLYLEWAPMGVFSGRLPQQKEQDEKPGGKEAAQTEAGPDDEATENTQEKKAAALEEKTDALGEEEDDEDEDDESLPGCTLFIKNLNFSTTEKTLKEVFSKVGMVKSCTVSKKKNKAGVLLSMGFGFVEYRKPEQAQKALKQLQGCMVDDHKLEVKISERAIKPAVTSARQKQTARKQRTSKILVRNIPFQANVREIRELFSTFGELKTVRLPKKMTGTGPHRGFGFVDFLTKQDAKRAFNALCHSTHLYGRRLVLEWADTEETVQALRRKTAQHFHDSPKKRRSVVLDEILEQLEEGENEDGE